MAKHLSRRHKIHWQPKKAAPQSQITSFSSNLKHSSKPIDSELVSQINSNLALAIATSSASNRFVDNDFFRKFLNLLNPAYSPVSHQTIGRLIQSKYEELKETLMIKISKAQSLSVTVDYWSSSNSLGFIGIIVSFIEHCHKNHLLIAVRYAPSPHTASNILATTNRILIEFGIQGVEDPRVFSITTDNGSNVVCACKHIKHDYSLTLSQSDQNIVEDGFESDLEDDSDKADVFVEISLKKRIACSNHLLNNNLKCVIMKNELIVDLLCRVKSLVRSFKYKQVVCDFMKEKGLKKFILPPATRWTYHYELIKSFLANAEEIPYICSLIKIDNISVSDYDSLKKLSAILELYKIKTLEFESTNCKLSDTIVYHLTLMCELKEIDDGGIFSKLIQKLIGDLVTRIKHIFDPKNEKFCLVYGLATFLDPSTKQYLDLPDNVIDGISMAPVKREVIAFLSNILRAKSSSVEKPPNKKSLLDSFLQESTEHSSELSL